MVTMGFDPSPYLKTVYVMIPTGHKFEQKQFINKSHDQTWNSMRDRLQAGVSLQCSDKKTVCTLSIFELCAATRKHQTQGWNMFSSPNWAAFSCGMLCVNRQTWLLVRTKPFFYEEKHVISSLKTAEVISKGDPKIDDSDCWPFKKTDSNLDYYKIHAVYKTYKPS